MRIIVVTMTLFFGVRAASGQEVDPQRALLDVIRGKTTSISFHDDFDDEAMRKVAPLLVKAKSLKWIHLEDTQITTVGLNQLAGMQLERLYMPGELKTDDGLEPYLAAIAPRQKLNIRYWKITDAGLLHLATQTRLRELTLGSQRGREGNCNITDAGFEQLAGLKNLQRLNLFFCKIDGSGLKHLGEAQQLEVLWLPGTAINDAAMVHIARFKNLEVLNLNGSTITDAGIEHLTSLKKLRYVLFDSPAITDAGLTQLMKNSSLQRLEIGSKNQRITEQGVAEFCNLLPTCRVNRH